MSKAINSMFRWYQRAEICFVYLSDVEAGTSSGLNAVELDETICESRYFTRGWTLQEILAPPKVYFYSRDNQRLGSKKTLKSLIHRATNIPIGALEGAPLTKYSIKKRLSWIEKRETHEPEDIAYCMLGLFDINMTLIYGEGRENALRRLEEEVRKRENGRT